MKWGERFREFAKTGNEKYKDPKWKPTKDEEAMGGGDELAERMIHPEKYKRKLVKKAIRKLKKKKLKGIRAELKKFGRRTVRMPKLKLGKRMVIKLRRVVKK